MFFSKQTRLIFYGILGTLAVLFLQCDVVFAQEPLTWSARQRIPGSGDDADTPYLVADQARTIHAFHVQSTGGEVGEQRMAIFYSRWNATEGWSSPVDVLITGPGGSIRTPAAYLDQRGVLHLVYYCCDDWNPQIYYSKAPLVHADRAPEWTVPTIVGRYAASPGSLTIAGDSQDNLYAVYLGQLDGGGNGVYSIRSSDRGSNWSDPELILATHNQRFPFDFKSQMDPQDRLHITWTVNSPVGNGETNYYARLDDFEGAWSEPRLLTQTGQYNSLLSDQIVERVYRPNIVWHKDVLTVIDTVCEPCQKQIRYSTDGGESWTEPVAFEPSRGDYGPVTFAVDSSNVLYAVWGDRALGESLWYRSTAAQPGPWSAPKPIVPIVEGDLYADDPSMRFSPADSHTIIVQGDTMMVSWRLDAGVGSRNGTWYSITKLESPELPVVAPPVPQATAVPNDAGSTVSLDAYMKTHTPQPLIRQSVSGEVATLSTTAESDENSPVSPLLIGLFSATLILVGVAMVRTLRHNR